MSVRSFTEHIGLKQGVLHNIVAGRKSKPSFDVLEKIISSFDDIDVNWLMTGDRVSYQYKSPENTIAQESIVDFYPKIITVNESNDSAIMLVPVKAQAGYLPGLADTEYFESLPTISVPGFRNSTYRAFEVSGYSMLHEGAGLYPGDIVIGEFVEHPKHIRDDRVYIIVCHAQEVDNVIIKRCKNRLHTEPNKLVCLSDNRDNDYPPIVMDIQEVKEVWEFKMKLSRHIPMPSNTYDRINELEAQVALINDILRKNIRE